MKTSGNTARTAMDGQAFDDTLLAEIRSKMEYMESDPYTGKRIFLENAGGSLRLKTICDVLGPEVALPDNTGRQTAASAHVSEAIGKGNADAGLFLGARSGRVFADQTTTRAIFRVVRAIAENVRGTNIVTTALEHPSIYDSTRWYAEQTGQEWRVAGLNKRTGGVDVESILAKVDANTSLLAFIQASNVTGAVLDAEKIIREARKIHPNLHVVVDGTQHAPHACVDVEALGCDAYFFAPYKILGKNGMSFGWISDRVSKLPHEHLFGKDPLNWDLGTQEHTAYLCWTKVVDYLAWLGGRFSASTNRRTLVVAAMERIEAHERTLLARILRGNGKQPGLFAQQGVSTFGIDKDTGRHDCVVGFNLRGLSAPDAVGEYLRRGIVVHNRVRDAYSRHILEALGVESLVRLSGLHYNTPAEIDRFLEATRELCER